MLTKPAVRITRHLNGFHLLEALFVILRSVQDAHRAPTSVHLVPMTTRSQRAARNVERAITIPASVTAQFALQLTSFLECPRPYTLVLTPAY